jgi:AcrR family transcriptional regulator
MLATPNRDRRSERREATRQEILAAAWAVAREQGLSQVTLREVADRVGMRAPSLYSHFESKNAIPRPRTARAGLRRFARRFFDYAVADLARHQLMNQRTIPGFVPSEEAYAPAVEVIRMLRERLERYGVRRQQDIDLYTAIVGGLVDGQLANDPGGTRYARLLDRAVDMFSDNLGL